MSEIGEAEHLIKGDVIQDQEDGERKVTLTICTTPTELRMIADHLEQVEQVRVNWYHTRYIFKRDNPRPSANQE